MAERIIWAGWRLHVFARRNEVRGASRDAGSNRGIERSSVQRLMRVTELKVHISPSTKDRTAASSKPY